MKVAGHLGEEQDQEVSTAGRQWMHVGTSRKAPCGSALNCHLQTQERKHYTRCSLRTHQCLPSVHAHSMCYFAPPLNLHVRAMRPLLGDQSRNVSRQVQQTLRCYTSYPINSD